MTSPLLKMEVRQALLTHLKTLAKYHMLLARFLKSSVHRFLKQSIQRFDKDPSEGSATHSDTSLPLSDPITEKVGLCNMSKALMNLDLGRFKYK